MGSDSFYDEENGKHTEMTQMSVNGVYKPQEALIDTPAIANEYISADGQNVVGDADADGTEIATYTLAIGKKLAIMDINANAKAAAIWWLQHGALGSATVVKSFRTEALKNYDAHSDKVPLVVIDNSAGTTTLNVALILPKSVDAATTNNANTQYASASFAGIVF